MNYEIRQQFNWEKTDTISKIGPHENEKAMVGEPISSFRTINMNNNRVDEQNREEGHENNRAVGSMYMVPVAPVV